MVGGTVAFRFGCSYDERGGGDALLLFKAFWGEKRVSLAFPIVCIGALWETPLSPKQGVAGGE